MSTATIDKPDSDRALTAEDIFAADDRVIRKVRVPEWQGHVYVKMMTGTDRDRWEAGHADDPADDARAKLIALTACDQSGRLLFRYDQVPGIGAKGVAGLQRVFQAALKLNRITVDDLEELEKN